MAIVDELKEILLKRNGDNSRVYNIQDAIREIKNVEKEESSSGD